MQKVGSQEMKVARLESKRETVTVCNAILYIETFKDSKKKKPLTTIFLNEKARVPEKHLLLLY